MLLLDVLILDMMVSAAPRLQHLPLVKASKSDPISKGGIESVNPQSQNDNMEKVCVQKRTKTP